MWQAEIDIIIVILFYPLCQWKVGGSAGGGGGGGRREGRCSVLEVDSLCDCVDRSCVSVSAYVCLCVHIGTVFFFMQAHVCLYQCRAYVCVSSMYVTDSVSHSATPKLLCQFVLARVSSWCVCSLNVVSVRCA